MEIKRLSEKIDEIRKTAGRMAMDAGGELLKVLAKGLQASADFLESDSESDSESPPDSKKPKLFVRVMR